MLGILPEPEEQPSPSPTTADSATSSSRVGIASEVLKQIADAETKRAQSSNPEEVGNKIRDSLERIIQEATKMEEREQQQKTDGSSSPDSSSSSNNNGEKQKPPSMGEEVIRKEVEQLVATLNLPRTMNQEDLKKLREQVFGASVFWITKEQPAEVEGGIFISGNLRCPREEVFERVAKKVAEVFPDNKYLVRFVEDVQPTEEWMNSGGGGGDAEVKPAFEILPTVMVTPEETPGWARVAGGVLLLLTLGSAAQFGLASNIGLLPRETLLWLANPDNLANASGLELLPPGLENYDPVPFMASAATVSTLALLPQLAHEIGHAVSAGMLGLKIAPSFLIPNGQLATFGSITQLKSFARNRKNLFDFAASGLFAGTAISMLLFTAGVVATHGGASAEAGLIPVPPQLFQGSLLLGSLAKLALDPAALTHSSVYVSPLLIGGWCGLVTSALNMLPVGNLDGGRMMLSAYGRNTLGFTSLASYVGLGLGLLGSSLALPFGLYILICQRTAEAYIQDEITDAGEVRRAVVAAAVAVAVLILLPGSPDVSETSMLLTSPPGNFI